MTLNICEKKLHIYSKMDFLHDVILRQGQERHPLLLNETFYLAVDEEMPFVTRVSCSKDTVDGPVVAGIAKIELS